MNVRGRLRELKARLDYVKEQASIQQPVQETLFENYRKASKSIQPNKEFEFGKIGSSALKDTAKHPTNGQNRPDNRWGYGLVQPVEALKAL